MCFFEHPPTRTYRTAECFSSYSSTRAVADDARMLNRAFSDPFQGGVLFFFCLRALYQRQPQNLFTQPHTRQPHYPRHETFHCALVEHR